MRTKLKIIIHNKLKLNDEIENQKYFYKRVKEKKINKDWTGRNKTWQIKIEGLNQKQIKIV